MSPALSPQPAESVKIPLPVISCIIVNYNAGNRLCDCVTSVLQNKVDLEILVIDNASSDTSITDLLAQFSGDSRIKISRNTTNSGFSAACNQGSRQSQGDFLLFLNPDCIIDQVAITQLISVFDDSGKVGMVGPLLLNPDGSEQAGGRRLAPTPVRSLAHVLPISKLVKWFPSLRSKAAFLDFNLNKLPVPEQPVDVEAISGACMLISREAQSQVGGFDEGYFIHCEDLDLCIRFRQNSWKIMFVPTARVTHFSGTCSQSRPIFVEWHKHRGMVRYYNKFPYGKHSLLRGWLVTMSVWLRFGFLALIKPFS